MESTNEALPDPVLSVVIPAYNARASLPVQLQALADQVDAPPFEVIVADNRSTDGTAAVARAFPAPFPVRVVAATQAQGSSHARNAGALAASTDTLAFCDADDIADPHWLATLHRAYLASGGAIVAGNLDTSENPAEVRAAYRIDAAAPAIESAELVIPAGNFASFRPTVCSANFVMSRRDYLAAQGMDESYRGGCEETDFTWRAVENGARVMFCPTATIYYSLRSGAKAMMRQQRNYQRERVLLWLRFRDQGMPGPSLRVSTLVVARELVTAPLWTLRAASRLQHAWSLGGHFGALEGMIRYRFLGSAPLRALMRDAA